MVTGGKGLKDIFEFEYLIRIWIYQKSGTGF